jgi:hypothetical protein
VGRLRRALCVLPEDGTRRQAQRRVCIVADGAHLRRAFQNGGSSIVHL